MNFFLFFIFYFMIDTVTEDDYLHEIIKIIIEANISAGKEDHLIKLQLLDGLEKTPIAFTEKILDILCRCDTFIFPLEYMNRLEVIIYIKNWLNSNSKCKDLSNITNIKSKILSFLSFYLNQSFLTPDSFTYEKKIRQFFEDITSSLFKIVSSFDEPNQFLNHIFNQILKSKFDLMNNNINNNNNNVNNNHNEFINEEQIEKCIIIFENISLTFLNFTNNQNEIGFILDFYSFIIQYSETIVKTKMNEIIDNISSYNNNNDINLRKNIMNKIENDICKVLVQSNYSFCKTAMKLFDFFTQNYIYTYKLYDDLDKYISESFLENEKFLFFLSNCLTLYYDPIRKDFIKDHITYIQPLNINLNIELEDPKVIFANTFNITFAKTKGLILELLSIILHKLYCFKLHLKFPKLSSALSIITKSLLISLISSYNTNYFPIEKVNNHKEEISNLLLVVKAYIYLENTIKASNGDSVIFEYRFDILQYIIIPSILKSPLEEHCFKNEPEEYVKTMLDVCHLCSEKMPRQKALKLLMCMCDELEGFFNYVVDLYIKVLNTICKTRYDGKIPDDDRIYKFLTEKLDEKSLFDQSMLIFSVISYLFPEKTKMKDYFEDNINILNSYLIKVNNDYLKSKLVAFYMYNLDDLFHNQTEITSKSFEDSLGFIFECVLSVDCPSLAMFSLNALNSVIFDDSLKKFCINQVKIYATKIINSSKVSNMTYYENDLNVFIKGILENYLIYLDQDCPLLIEHFWNEFEKNLDQAIKDFVQYSYKEKIPLSEKKDTSYLASSFNIMTTLLKLIADKGAEVKNFIYQKILRLLNSLGNFFKWEYEENLLNIITMVFNDVKLLPPNYTEQFENYLNIINLSYENKNMNIDPKLESYHISFIFSFLKCIKKEQIIECKFKEKLFELTFSKLFIIPKKKSVQEIITDHFIYVNFLIVQLTFFYNELTEGDIQLVLTNLIKRLNTQPNNDLSLSVKIYIAVFILILKMEDLKDLDKIQLEPFLVKMLSTFPLNELSVKEHEIIAINICSIIRKLLEMSFQTSMGNLTEKDENFFQRMISLLIDELHLILKKTKENSQLRRMRIFNCTDEDNDYDKEFYEQYEDFVEELGNEEYSFKNRREHINNKLQEKICLPCMDSSNDENISDDYEADKENKENIQKEDDDYSNSEDILSNNDFFYKDDSDEEKDNSNSNDNKDDEFIIKATTLKFKFEEYYNKYADLSLKIQLNKINPFEMLHLMLKDIEANNQNLLNKIYQSLDKKKQNNLRNYIQYKKISINIDNKGTNQIYIYRKVLSIKKKK